MLFLTDDSCHSIRSGLKAQSVKNMNFSQNDPFDLETQMRSREGSSWCSQGQRTEWIRSIMIIINAPSSVCVCVCAYEYMTAPGERRWSGTTVCSSRWEHWECLRDLTGFSDPRETSTSSSTGTISDVLWFQTSSVDFERSFRVKLSQISRVINESRLCWEISMKRLLPARHEDGSQKLENLFDLWPSHWSWEHERCTPHTHTHTHTLVWLTDIFSSDCKWYLSGLFCTHHVAHHLHWNWWEHALTFHLH